MRNILTIAKREVTRLRTRFGGRSRFIILSLMGFSLVIGYVIFQQDIVMSKGFYTIGLSPNSPAISDGRFNTVILERDSGFQMLREGTIDVYLDGNEVAYRGDQRSQYAAGALKQVLEKQELIIISHKYDIDKAFPLRLEVNYLEAPEGNAGAEIWVSLENIIESAGEGIGDGDTSLSTIFKSSPTDAAVREQLEEFNNAGGGGLPEFKAEFVSDKEIIIPSLMNPPVPLAQVIIAFFYVVPIFFISIFFTSSFMEEKINRKLNILLSTPVTPFQIIMGKMLPYIVYSIISIIVITLLLKGNVLLALAIFIPIMLFILSIYLTVSLLYGTFRNQTFFSLLAVSGITAYLIFPAMLSGISDLSSISPLSLAVDMYKGESFGLIEYFLSTTPMYLVFALAMLVGVRVFNEEYLIGFRPLHVQLGEAIYLTMDKKRPYLSVFLLSLLLIPAVFMVQLGSIVIASNLPIPFALGALLVVSAVVEEVAKSSGIAVLIKNNAIKSLRSVLAMSLLSVIGFFIGEKLLLYMALSVISESIFTTVIFGGGLLILPFIAHFVFTATACLIMARFGIKYYPLAIAAGAVIHVAYNMYVIGMML